MESAPPTATPTVEPTAVPSAVPSAPSTATPEEQKSILYEFQLLHLETGGGGFSTTTDLLVRSGQIPTPFNNINYRQDMSNEQIAKYISEYIIKNWNKFDIDRAVRESNSALPGLRLLNEPLLKKKQDENEERTRKNYERAREADFDMMQSGNVKTLGVLIEELKKSYISSSNDNVIRNIIEDWINKFGFSSEESKKTADRYFEFYKIRLLPQFDNRFGRQKRKYQIYQMTKNKCRYCNRQKNGRFDTCCQGCVSGTHTSDCDKRNGKKTTSVPSQDTSKK